MTPDVSRLIFGTHALGAMPNRRSAFRLLEAALELGLSHFDTARLYSRGFSEKLIGEFVRSHGIEIRVTAKVGLGNYRTSVVPSIVALPINSWRKRLARTSNALRAPSAAVPPLPPALSYDYVARSVEETFKLLGVRQLDTLLLHEHLPINLDGRAIDFLLGLLTDGIAGRLGVGTDANVIETHYEEVSGFTVLQYDGTLRPMLIRRFPNATHFQFGFLRRHQGGTAAETLAAAQEGNPGGKIVFSTTSIDRLRSNVRRNSR